jgi:hypothetical protein
VGLLAALVVVVALRRRWLLIAPAAVVLVVALATPTPLRSKIVSIFDPSSPSVSERLYFWDAGRRMADGAVEPEKRPPTLRRSILGYRLGSGRLGVG